MNLIYTIRDNIVQRKPLEGYSIQERQAVAQVLGYENVKLYNQEEARRFGVFGLAVFMPITLEEIRYSMDGVQWIVPQMELLCCVSDVVLPKTVVKSRVTKRNGTRKEYVSCDDYQVTIRGIVSGEPGDGGQLRRSKLYPMGQVKQLHDFAKAPVAVPVVNDLWNELGIYSLVIENLNLQASPGKENMQAFEMQCTSDEPMELTLRKEELNLIL